MGILLFQKASEFLFRHRTGVIKALNKLDVQGRNQALLLLGFNTLCDDCQRVDFRHFHNGAQQRVLLGIGGNLLRQGAIDFDYIYR